MKEQDTVLFLSTSSELEKFPKLSRFTTNKFIKYSFRSILKEAEIDDKELVKNIQQQTK